MNHIKVIIFDLDGTLYEDTHHFSYYAQCLQKRLPKEKKGSFNTDYNTALTGKHPLQIGRIYDAKHDLILIQKENFVIEAYEWNGQPCTEERVRELYPGMITVDLDQMFSIGDLWWIPSSIARHYGLGNHQTYEAFMDTRQYMMSPEFHMNPVAGLRETIENLKKQCQIILMTNSPQPDSEAILQKLFLKDMFDHKIYEARKPIMTKQHIEDIQQKYGVYFSQMMSIGDNWINEIFPAQELGCKTIFIDPYHRSGEDQADIIVKRIGEIIPILRS